LSIVFVGTDCPDGHRRRIVIHTRNARASIGGVVLATLYFGAAAASAEVVSLPARFDLKPAAAGYAPGYVGIDSNATFSVATAYGFEPAASDARWGEHPCDDIVARDDEERALLRGCVRVPNGARFAVRLPPLTKVRGRVIVSSVPYWFAPGTTHYQPAESRIDDLSVSVSKGAAASAIVAGDIDLRTPYLKGSLDTPFGSYRKIWFTGTAGADGVLRIGFHGPTGVTIPVAAIEIYPYANAPITYRRQAGAYLSSPSGASIPGLAAFNAHDYTAARTAFATIQDPLTRAYAFAFLAGWLDGAADDFGADLATAAAALADPSLASTMRAIELRDRLEDLANAERHYRLRGFSFAYPLPPDGEGWFNTDDPAVILSTAQNSKSASKHFYLAESLYAQAVGHTLDPLVAFNANAHPDADFEVSPFAFRSLERIAKIHTGMNPTHGILVGGVADPDRVAALDVAESILRGFDTHGFLVNEFSGNGELAALSYAARPEIHQHSQDGGLFSHWNGSSIASTAFSAATPWWDSAILPSDPDPSVPSWADAQRRYLHAFRHAVDWWMSVAMIDNEFGGGLGDDIELLGQLALPYVAIENPGDSTVRDALIAIAKKTLDSDLIADGYYQGAPNDVEHTAEFTTYPLAVGLALDPSDPALRALTLAVSRHLAAPNPGSAPWSILLPSGKRRFASYYFTTSGPPDPLDPQFAPYAYDVPLNAKAMVPALHYLATSPNAALESDLLAWLANWRDAALATHPGLPRGLAPAAIRAADGAFGYEGNWWQTYGGAGAGYSFPANLQGISQLQSGFFATAHDLADSDNHLWLLPSLRLIQGALALEAQIDAGAPPSDIATVGTANWALATLLSAYEFWKLGALMRPRLATDSVLRTTDDPEKPGNAPYVDDAFLAALDAALAEHGGGYPNHLAIPQGPIDVIGGTYGRKGKIPLTSQLQRGLTWLENYFPLATTGVLYTDRAFLFSQSSHQVLFGMLTGGELGFSAPDHLCSWKPTSAADPVLDIAAIVNDYASGTDGSSPRLRVLVYNFEDSPRDVTIRLWHRLPFGHYAFRRGKALATTDYFEGGAFTASTITFDERGDGFSFPLASRTLTLLEFERTGDAPIVSNVDVALGAATDPLEVDESTTPPTLRVNVLASTTSEDAIGPEQFTVRVVVRDSGGNPMKLAKDGATTNSFALDAGSNGLPASSGYDDPTATLTRSLPLSPHVVDLVELGCVIEFEFDYIASDADAANDTITLTLDLAALSALLPDITPQEPSLSPKKLAKLLAKKAKKLGKAWLAD
jgi:hypothetical protein